MRFYGNYEEADKEARGRAADYRTAAGYIPAITKVIKDFDGKVYNCRLEKALRAATDNKVSCEKTQYSLTIYTYPTKNYSYRIRLADIKAEDLPEGKRIPAAKILESFTAHRESLLKLAYDIESNIDQMQQVKAYIQETKNKLEAYCRSFNTDLRDIYNIPYCIRTD